MPAVDELLADLAAHPPSDPTPVGEIRGRARRRVLRRRVVAGAAVVLAVSAAGLAVGAAATDDPRQDVVADGGIETATDQSTTGPTEPPSTTTSVPTTSVEPAVTVDGDGGTVGDGDTLLVTLTGVETGDVYTVDQCIPAVAPEVEEGGWICSDVRARSITVARGPETQLTFTAFHDVFVNTADPGGWAPAWARCEPCQLQVRAQGGIAPIVRLPLEMEPTDDPIRPRVTLDPPGPHAPGSEVGVRAAGLQPSTSIAVAWCIVLPPQGGGDSPCSFEGEGGTASLAVGVDGTGELSGYVLPTVAGVQGEDCVARAGACGVGLHAPSWWSYVAIAPLDLGG